MLATEMIEKLRELIQDHGDLPVYMDDESTPSIEFDEDYNDPAFVIS